MRPTHSLFPFLALLAISAFAAQAHADDFFTYIPTGGAAISFTLNNSEIYNVSPGFAAEYGPITYSNGSVGVIAIDNPAFGLIYDNGHYPDDFSIQGSVVTPGVGYAFGGNFEGPQLYSGDINSPVFLPGIYELGPRPIDGDFLTATLCIDEAVCAVPPATPEPSSFVLLGTGVLGIAGAARRRFSKR